MAFLTRIFEFSHSLDPFPAFSCGLYGQIIELRGVCLLPANAFNQDVAHHPTLK
jgi:hypothetical protein